MRIFFITRTFPDDTTGGAIIRKGTINFLKKNGYEVWIIAPNYSNNKLIIKEDEQYILCPIKVNMRLSLLFETFGIWDDYLEHWAKKTIHLLENIVTKDDLIFATSGGELGPFLLGILLKQKKGCKLIFNLHDPIGFTHINNTFIKYYSLFSYHASRDKVVGQYLMQADAIVTSTIAYMNLLKSKYKLGNIYSWYFGYINQYQYIPQIRTGCRIHIIYGGALGKLQRIDLFLKEAVKFENIDITIIGNYSANKKLKEFYNKVNFLSPMPQEEYLDFLYKNADVGFLSLDGVISNLCIPSKFYEYINLGIPMLAIIGGDTKQLIVEFNYGVVADFSEQSIRDALQLLTNEDKRKQWKKNIIHDRETWSMENQIKNLITIIENN